MIRILYMIFLEVVVIRPQQQIKFITAVLAILHATSLDMPMYDNCIFDM